MARRLWIRNHEAGHLVEIFLIAAIAAVLSIRFYLDLTGYPSVGGDTLHIAHMLWGGLLMLGAIVMLLSFLDRGAVHQAAIVGGIGFGTFIDELGKFVTRNNDYFFQPTIAMIYLVFVLTFLAARSVRSRGAFSPDEWLVNALRETENLAIHDLDAGERKRALTFLERSDPEHPLVPPLRTLLRNAEPKATASTSFLTIARRRARGIYRRLAAWPWFSRGLVIFFLVQLGIKISYSIGLIFWIRGAGSPGGFIALLDRFAHHQDSPTLLEWAEIGSSLLSGFFVLLGVLALHRSRLLAYRMFQRSIVVTILLTQVFMFYREQFSALTGLALNVAILAALDSMIEREQEDPAAAEGSDRANALGA